MENDSEPFGLNVSKRPFSPEAENILYKPFNVLDHGFVRLVDYMGNDNSVVQAARVSYGNGTKRASEDEALIRYLMRHKHTTPFEMVEMKFHAKMPIFVARQWIRHRTASVNEVSARYSILPNEFYIPSEDDLAIQSINNKQGRGETLSPQQAREVMNLLRDDGERAYTFYKDLLNEDLQTEEKIDPQRPGIARELARMGLTLNFYTEWYWKTNLHNLFHFLKLRMDPHAQKEIRVYADEMAKITQAVAPVSYKAFHDYRLHSIELSLSDQIALSKLLREQGNVNDVAESSFENKREREEFLRKFQNILR